jgi:tetratricopeptide (TPR) repeat protein
MTQTGYDAFISYRRSDGTTVARWLRRELENFRLPRSLRASFDRKLRVYLDTAYERGTSDFYEGTVKPALLASRYLLVVATPDAVQRAEGRDDWIRREVVDFTAGPNGANVIAVRGSGEFNDPLPAELTSRFRNIEIVDLRGASRLWFLNPTKASRLASERLKLIAPLIDLPADAMPRLRQEDERRQQARLGTAAGASLAVLTAVSATSIFALQSSFKAARALEDSMFSTGRMIISATAASGEARSRLLSQGCDLLDKLREGSPSEPGLQEIVICGVERAAAHEQLEEHAQARTAFDKTITATEARYERTPRQDVGLRHLQALQALAEYLARRKDEAGEEAAYMRLRDRARELLKVHERVQDIAEAEGEGAGQLGDILARGSKHAEAEASYLAAADAVAQAIEWSTDSPSPRNVSWHARLFRLAGEKRMALRDDPGALAHLQRSLEISAGIKQPTHDMTLDMAYASALAFSVQRTLGQTDVAEASRSAALKAAEQVHAARGVDARSRQRAQSIRDWIASRSEGK